MITFLASVFFNPGLGVEVVEEFVLGPEIVVEVSEVDDICLLRALSRAYKPDLGGFLIVPGGDSNLLVEMIGDIRPGKR